MMLATKLQEAAANSTLPTYIEDVFSTYLYTGNGSTQTITNGIDLSTKGGLVWTKNRTSTTAGRNYHRWNDSARGVTFALESNLIDPQDNLGSGSISSFNTTGYTLGGTTYNNASDPWVSWTFRKQPKFFDIVTYTGNGTVKTVNHNLGSVPGVMIVKCTSAGENWAVYHRSLGATKYIELNNTNAASTSVGSRWDAEPTSTSFSVGYNGSVNSSGATYVAYLFAHNAGGFGLTGTDNVISCGSFTTDGSGNATVSLGYEPQWLLVKDTVNATDWYLTDTMRPWANNSGYEDVALRPNLSNADYAGDYGYPTETGFYQTGLNASTQHIYIAIRRGPMKVPTSGTSVFTPDVGRTDYVNPQFDSTFPVVDTFFNFITTQGIVSARDRLRGSTQRLVTYTTGAETVSNNPLDYMYGAGDSAATNSIGWMFSRAPGFHDVVCWTGNGGSGTRTITHNLTVAPELIIVKCRNNIANWVVGNTNIGWTHILNLSTTAASTLNSAFADTAPTSSVFSLRKATGDVNEVGWTYVAYLFATLAGVSKVGSYTGTGATQTISCGFTGGARFVLIKNASTGGSWYVWDTARGMVSGTDPSVLLNSFAAEVNANSVYTTTGGFQIVSTVDDINGSGITYIYLAIA